VSSEAADITGFLFETGVLKRYPRTGWVLAGVPAPESVADHSFRPGSTPPSPACIPHPPSRSPKKPSAKAPSTGSSEHSAPGNPEHGCRLETALLPAFPANLAADVRAVAAVLPQARLHPSGSYAVRVQGEHLSIPYRLYNPEPAGDARKTLWGSCGISARP
jgi:hypothetical protein